MAQAEPVGQKDSVCTVVTLLVEPANAGIVSWVTDPTVGETDCRADRLTSTLTGDPMMVTTELTVAEIAVGDPVGVALPNSGTSGI